MLEDPHEYVSHLCINCSVYCVISGFRREVDENCALLGYYATRSGNYVPKFPDNLFVTSSRVFLESWPPKMGPIGCPETSVRNYHYSLRNNPEEAGSQIFITMCC